MNKFKIGDKVSECQGSFVYKIVDLSDYIIMGEVLSTTKTHWHWLVGQTLPLDPSAIILYEPKKKSHPLTNIFK